MGGGDLAGSRMGVFNGGREEKCAGVSLHGSATSAVLKSGHGGAGEPCPLQPSGSQHMMVGVLLLSQHSFMIAELSFTVIVVSLTSLFLYPSPLFFFSFFALINLSFLSLRCCKCSSVTHKINVPHRAVRKRGWHPAAPRQKANRT